MARIVYGVHGTGRGHAVRALTLAQHAPSHDFLFFSHGEAARLLGKEWATRVLNGCLRRLQHEDGVRHRSNAARHGAERSGFADRRGDALGVHVAHDAVAVGIALLGTLSVQRRDA